MSEQQPEKRNGFELEGEFHPWRVSDGVKDLQLIDRLTGGIGTAEFFQLIKDPTQRARGPIMLTLMATSIRADHPDWSIERVLSVINKMESLDDATFIGGEGEEDKEEDADPTTHPEGEQS